MAQEPNQSHKPELSEPFPRTDSKPGTITTVIQETKPETESYSSLTPYRNTERTLPQRNRPNRKQELHEPFHPNRKPNRGDKSRLQIEIKHLAPPFALPWCPSLLALGSCEHRIVTRNWAYRPQNTEKFIDTEKCLKSLLSWSRPKCLKSYPK